MLRVFKIQNFNYNELSTFYIIDYTLSTNKKHHKINILKRCFYITTKILLKKNQLMYIQWQSPNYNINIFFKKNKWNLKKKTKKLTVLLPLLRCWILESNTSSYMQSNKNHECIALIDHKTNDFWVFSSIHTFIHTLTISFD